jgi:tRNA(Ile)-lysidine synthase
MPTTREDPVITVRAAVNRWAGRVGPGLFGLACSGGADSMVLADAAIEECGATNVVVVHIDHGLRDESARIGTEISAWASGRGVAAVVRRVVVARGASVEAAARAARYAAFAHVADELGLASMWIAHTRDDQAETVLMRILRGTGPVGLAGMSEQRDRFVRPLLDIPRDVVRAYHAARELPEWYDPMNADLRITRVRMRDEVLPLLRKENRALDEALVRLATSTREWLNVIDDLARPHVTVPIECATVRLLPPAIRKRIYALALEKEGVGYDASHLEDVDALVTAPAAGTRELAVAGARVVRIYDQLRVVAHDREPAAAFPAADAPALPSGYELRTPRPGDRMKPARLKGRSRKLSDLFIDAKIPRDLRRSARVVVRTRDQVIVWAEYIGPAFGEAFQDI